MTRRWTIALQQVEVMLKIGIHPHEVSPQRVWIDVALEYEDARVPTTIGECVDYDRIYAYLRARADWPHTDLLETMAAEVADWILTQWPRVSAVRATITKPDIFPHAMGASVTLVANRERENRD